MRLIVLPFVDYLLASYKHPPKSKEHAFQSEEQIS
jgi:hypothetical protein